MGDQRAARADPEVGEVTPAGADPASGQPVSGPSLAPEMPAAPGSAVPEPAAPPAPTPPAPAPAPSADSADLGRRRFFRQLASDVFQATATVVGAATALQRTSMEAASALFDPVAGAAQSPSANIAGVSVVPSGEQAAFEPGAPRGFRSAFRVEPDRIILVDQRRLPNELLELECMTVADVAFGIREMVVRGAPAIGQVAAYGLALTAARIADQEPFARMAALRAAATALETVRPTAINLHWAIQRIRDRLNAFDMAGSGADLAAELRAEADAICAEATSDHALLAEHGLGLLPRPYDRPIQVLTHCNTGPLACGQFGTALGVVQAAWHAGVAIHVHVDETRPFLQGARLTAWELQQAGVPYTIIPDVAAGSLLASGRIDAVLVGADRVAANGDTANKVGTYPLAVLAQRHGVPFYVCAPLSSVDAACPDGRAIPIEERPAREVLELAGQRIAPPEATVWNPAFDVTPAELISAIVTEEGVIRSPYGPGLAAALASRRQRSETPS